eukprot:922262-Pelagomonas_calceolata.AAC.13
MCCGMVRVLVKVECTGIPLDYRNEPPLQPPLWPGYALVVCCIMRLLCAASLSCEPQPTSPPSFCLDDDAMYFCPASFLQVACAEKHMLAVCSWSSPPLAIHANLPAAVHASMPCQQQLAQGPLCGSDSSADSASDDDDDEQFAFDAVAGPGSGGGMGPLHPASNAGTHSGLRDSTGASQDAHSADGGGVWGAGLTPEYLQPDPSDLVEDAGQKDSPVPSLQMLAQSAVARTLVEPRTVEPHTVLVQVREHEVQVRDHEVRERCTVLAQVREHEVKVREHGVREPCTVLVQVREHEVRKPRTVLVQAQVSHPIASEDHISGYRRVAKRVHKWLHSMGGQVWVRGDASALELSMTAVLKMATEAQLGQSMCLRNHAKWQCS